MAIRVIGCIGRINGAPCVKENQFPDSLVGADRGGALCEDICNKPQGLVRAVVVCLMRAVGRYVW